MALASKIVRAGRRLPETVRALSWVSLANDAGSELAYPVLPLFLTVTLGAPVAVIGLIEGIAEGATVALRGVAGRLACGGSPGSLVAVIPGAFALLLLGRVREVPRPERVTRDMRTRLPRAFWIAVTVWVVFSIGNSSDVFLLLRARDLGLGATLVVLAYALYNLVYSALSWLCRFAVGPPSWAVWPLFAVYGVYVAATEGAARAWIADRMGESLAGTAYGVFSAATGAALLAASVTAGLLWSHVSHAAPFALGAVSAVAALGLLAILRG